MHISKRAALWALEFFFVLLVAVVALFMFGPAVEARLAAPAFSNVRGTIIHFDTLHTDVLVAGIKSRACLLVGANVQVFVNGTWVPGVVEMLKEDGSVLETSEQRIGVGAPFIRLLRVQPGGTGIKIRTESICHPLWHSMYDLIEIDSTKIPAQVR